jgi:transcriptional regulator with XRE-family HTH domain
MPDRVRHARRLLGISQSEFAKRVGVGPSAVAQWELPRGTSPNVAHMMRIAQSTGVAFEWLATGRGTIRVDRDDTPAVEASLFAADVLEERLLLTFRRVTAKRREALVRWLEDFV